MRSRRGAETTSESHRASQPIPLLNKQSRSYCNRLLPDTGRGEGEEIGMSPARATYRRSRKCQNSVQAAQ